MSDSDEESVMSVRRLYSHGGDIFRKHEPGEFIEGGWRRRGRNKKFMRMKKMKTRKKTTIMRMRRNMMMRMIMTRVIRMIRKFYHGMSWWTSLQKICKKYSMRQWKKTLEENPGTYIQEAEKIAYHDLKPKYLSHFICHYKNLTE